MHSSGLEGFLCSISPDEILRELIMRISGWWSPMGVSIPNVPTLVLGGKSIISYSLACIAVRSQVLQSSSVAQLVANQAWSTSLGS